MARNVISKVIRPLPKGQITLPAAIRRALAISESSLLEVSLRGDKIVISKLETEPEDSIRLYSDEEIAEFFEEDKLTPDIEDRVRDLMRRGLA